LYAVVRSIDDRQPQALENPSAMHRHPYKYGASK
jgi:hypothetical protein